MIKYYKERQQWFKDRIGTRIFRGDTNCNHGNCESCKKIALEGLIITDELHACYLNDVSFELGIEYRDVQ